MRIFIKGGVWKNTEDEILKAAVMKYGKNQWARISSLLVRKSAKQCKARWYEWLDPSIKKTEWTREEDEKLLHLAKLMPMQWRTIAPVVGRTAAQCLDRYEKLLDQAQGQDGDLDPADDPRRLKPGEIDPNPEGKPARPDPIDMDEDEKEMLQEARARLANTKGKKAKRKAREKQLEEARRLASLQKRRDLKAAGIGIPGKRKRKGQVNYNEEVPFERKVPLGFYAPDDSETPDPTNPDFKELTLEDVEGKRRTDIEEAKRKQDSKRQKKRKKKDMPGLAMQINQLNDPNSVRKRTKLQLPAPQMSDAELEEIVRIGYTSESIKEQLEENNATAGLLANYATPAAGGASFRTPRTPATSSDHLMKEAQNLVTLTQSSTPLMGGENTPLHTSDFSGATPVHKTLPTPNVHTTPLHDGQIGTGARGTPRVGGTPRAGGGTPAGATPMRDEMGINPDARSTGDVRSRLAKMPAPQNTEFEVVMPDLPEEEQEKGSEMVEDMADAEARKAERLAAAEEARLAGRSEALKRGLPRTKSVNTAVLRRKDAKLTVEQKAEELIKEEMLALIEADRINWPIETKKKKRDAAGKKKKKKRAVIEQFEPEQLEEARKELEKELEEIDRAPIEDILLAYGECGIDDIIMMPNTENFSGKASKNAKIVHYTTTMNNNRAEITTMAKRCLKAEKKLKILTGGFVKRADNLIETTSKTFDELSEMQRCLECYKALQKQEDRAIPQRLAGLTAEVNLQLEREADLQARYGNLLKDLEDVALAKEGRPVPPRDTAVSMEA